MTNYPVYIAILGLIGGLACIVGVLLLFYKILVWITRGGPNS